MHTCTLTTILPKCNAEVLPWTRADSDSHLNEHYRVTSTAIQQDSHDWRSSALVRWRGEDGAPEDGRVVTQAEVDEAEVLRQQQETVLPTLKEVLLLLVQVLLLQRELQVALGHHKGWKCNK